jgi:hypothetical protein
VYKVIDFCSDDKGTLATLSLLSTGFQSWAEAYLYERLVIELRDNHFEGLGALRSIEGQPSRASYVKSIKMTVKEGKPGETPTAIKQDILSCLAGTLSLEHLWVDITSPWQGTSDFVASLSDAIGYVFGTSYPSQ